MNKITDKELINLRLKLRLVKEEIKNRCKMANANDRGLKKVLGTERKLIERIRIKENESGNGRRTASPS